MSDLENKTPEQLQQLIAEAQTHLEALQRNKRKEVVAKIKELAASINVGVEIIEDSKPAKKATISVPAKYANPYNSAEVWTGRGVAPKWMQILMAAGHSKNDFLINNA